jgi:hypothetical protein
MLTTTPAKTLPPLEGTITLEEAEEEGDGVAPLVIYQKGALSSLVKLCEFASTGDFTMTTIIPY